MRPETNEYAPYFEVYVSLVPETDVVGALENQLEELEALFAGLDDEKSLYAYEAGKWTIKELIGHLIDGERVFAYRALRFARADETPLQGFDQDLFIANANFNDIQLADLVGELLYCRQANVLFFRNLPPEAWSRVGRSSDNPVSVRALAYIMVGHIRHHVAILRERYLAG